MRTLPGDATSGLRVSGASSVSTTAILLERLCGQPPLSPRGRGRIRSTGHPRRGVHDNAVDFFLLGVNGLSQSHFDLAALCLSHRSCFPEHLTRWAESELEVDGVLDASSDQNRGVDA